VGRLPTFGVNLCLCEYSKQRGLSNLRQSNNSCLHKL